MNAVKYESWACGACGWRPVLEAGRSGERHTYDDAGSLREAESCCKCSVVGCGRALTWPRKSSFCADCTAKDEEERRQVAREAFSQRKAVPFEVLAFALEGPDPERLLHGEGEALDLAVARTGEKSPTAEQVREALEGLELVPGEPVTAPIFNLEEFLADELPDEKDHVRDLLADAEAIVVKLNEALKAVGPIAYVPSSHRRIDIESILRFYK